MSIFCSGIMLLFCLLSLQLLSASPSCFAAPAGVLPRTSRVPYCYRSCRLCSALDFDLRGSCRSKVEGMEASVKAILTEEKVRVCCVHRLRYTETCSLTLKSRTVSEARVLVGSCAPKGDVLRSSVLFVDCLDQKCPSSRDVELRRVSVCRSAKWNAGRSYDLPTTSFCPCGLCRSPSVGGFRAKGILNGDPTLFDIVLSPQS